MYCALEKHFVQLLFSGREYVGYIKRSSLVSLVIGHGSASCVQPSNKFSPLFGAAGAKCALRARSALHVHAKADCTQMADFCHCESSLANVALRLTCIFLPAAQLLFAHVKAVTCHPIAQRESETHRRRPGWVHKASSPFQ